MSAGVTSWGRAEGEDLVNAYGGSSNDSMLENAPAIYLWKRNLRPEFSEKNNSQKMLDWCRRLVETPVASFKPSRISHSARSLGFELVGSLDTKADQMYELLKSHEGRDWVFNYLKALEDHAPALYVGQTDNLERRIKEHLRGSKGFGREISDNPAWDWSSLHLRYYLIDGPAAEIKHQLEAIEYVTQVITIAGLTTRAG